MLLRRVTYENLRRNNNRRNSRSDSRKVFALRPETSLRIYTYAPDRHSLPVRQTLPPVRKTETEEKTVRRLLLQIPARLRKVLTIINCGEATLLPPRFCHRVDDVSLLFVDEGYGRNTERNAVVFVGIFFGGFTVCPIAAELEVRRTYGKRLRFGFEMVRSEEVS